jgi:hypothetical protein
MARTLSAAVGTAVRDAAPFLAITLLWSVVMLLFYALFLVTKPAGVTYGPVIHGSVFAPPLIGFFGHVLREALRDE